VPAGHAHEDEPMLGELLGALTGSRTNLLLIFLPLAIGLELAHVSETWVFIAAAFSIIPLASLIGEGTEAVSSRVGPGIGGLLNATFGNGAELLIAGFALHAGLVDVVKASLAGSILGNTLLVLGAAMFLGGIGRTSQAFSATGASAKSLSLFLAVAGLTMPAVFDMTVLGSLDRSNLALDELSLATAIVLLGVYIAGLIFSLRTHADIFSGGDEASNDDHGYSMSMNGAVVLLLISTTLTAVAAELLVGAVEGAARALGMTDLFIGFIIVAVVGNAAEHYSAIIFARKNQMQLAINIAKDSSVQIALLVAPVLVIMSWVIGQPMNLVFNPFELFGLGLAVFAVTFVSLDGESNWFEGLLLLALYVIVGMTTYFVPVLR
jgi:Ca2+:H+ antiporter